MLGTAHSRACLDLIDCSTVADAVAGTHILM